MKDICYALESAKQAKNGLQHAVGCLTLRSPPAHQHQRGYSDGSRSCKNEGAPLRVSHYCISQFPYRTALGLPFYATNGRWTHFERYAVPLPHDSDLAALHLCFIHFYDSCTL